MKRVNMNDIGSIIADANYITEKALLPLSSVRSEADKARYGKKGYMPGYTYDEWPQKYPLIPRDKVYYLNGLNVGTVYYDKRNLVFLSLRIFGTDVMHLGDEENYQESICAAIKKQELHSKQKEYGHLFMAMPDGIKMDAMMHLLDLEGPTPLFYSNFTEQYTVANFHCGNLAKRVISALEKSKSEEQKQKTLQSIEALYQGRDVITVYRGEADGSTDYRQAMSWSTNINVAFFFATRLGKNAVLRTGKLYKKDVLEYFSAEEGEDEIITLPGKVKRVTSLSLLDIDSIDIKKNLETIVHWYHTWRDESVRLYKEIGDNIDDHNIMHTLRVLFLGIVIGLHENLTDYEMTQLCDAAMYHDSGRKTGDIEYGHGKASAKLYAEKCGQSPIVDFAIEMHCVDDKDAAELLPSRVPEKDRDSAWKILSVLKDADALDRVRFGFAFVNGRDGLDVNQLRYDYSKLLVPLAKQCLHHLDAKT